MKGAIFVMLLLVLCKVTTAQFLFGGSYKRFVPASDTSKYVYKTGGGVELQAGLGLGKKSGVLVMLTGGFDILKINHQTNSEKKDGWIFFMGGLRKDFVFGKAKKDGPGGDDTKSIFVGANYGVSLSNYTARVTGDEKKSLNTKLWNTGAGVHLAGFEFAYFYHNMEDERRSGWLPMHQFKIGISILDK